MCYEFVHACDSPLIDRISNLIGPDKYFMVCIGHLNYFYCRDVVMIAKVKDLLINNGIALYKISENELLSVVNFPDTKEFQIFHGSENLLNSLRQKFQINQL